jgi:hypothetical protein
MLAVASDGNGESLRVLRLLLKEPHDLALAFLPDEIESAEETGDKAGYETG